MTAPRIPWIRRTAVFLCAVAIFMISGCGETMKGLGRDLGSLKNMDAWFREHYW